MAPPAPVSPRRTAPAASKLRMTDLPFIAGPHQACRRRYAVRPGRDWTNRTDLGVTCRNGPLLSLRFAWGAAENRAKATDHMALVVEARVGGDLGGRRVGLAQEHQGALHALAPQGLMDALSDGGPVGARQPDRMDAQPL